MDSKDDILEAIKSLEMKFDAMQSREERNRQYSIMGYSIILAAVLSTLIYITFTIFETIIPQPFFLSFLALIGYLFIFVFIYYLGRIKKIHRVGDYVIKSDIHHLEQENKTNILEQICEIAKIDGKYQIENVQLSGLTKAGYLYKTFRENNSKKYDYLLKNVDNINSLDYLFGHFNVSSYISISFEKNNILINLSTKHFNLKQAKEILKKIRQIEKDDIIANVTNEGF